MSFRSVELQLCENAPVIEELDCENTGLDVYEQSQAYLPTFTISTFVSDEDGDFTNYQMLVKFDSELDGELGDDAVELGTISGSLNDEAVRNHNG